MYRQLLQDRLLSAVQTLATQNSWILPSPLDLGLNLAADTRYGDYQSNLAMRLAKDLKTNPRQLATDILPHLHTSDLTTKVTIDGPGFINFTISPEHLAKKSLENLQSPSLCVPPSASPKTIVIDFSAPNIAKPMHVGHIRSTIIGDSLTLIARFLGHNVITDNHIGDWGTQFGMILHGWKNDLNTTALNANPIEELVRLYKHVNAQTKAETPQAQITLDACRQELVKLQQGDPENHTIWQQCVQLSLQQLKIIYQRLDIQFDHYLGESYYNDQLAPLVADLLQRGIATLSDGATCIFFPEDPHLTDKPCIIRKSDGGFLYATTDLATLQHRANTFKADEIWYIVGAPQELHFKQIFLAKEKMGIPTTCHHITFGSILGQDGKMFRTRSGESVGLIDVLDEATQKAAEILATRDNLNPTEKQTTAEIIGIGAVKYAELSQNRITDYKFSWEKMLSLQGNTAPYLLNAYVRSRAIYRKLGIDTIPTTPLELTHPEEQKLALKLSQFAEWTHDVLNDHRPNLLANYLYELANSYHSFYEACHVLNAEGSTRTTRLQLCALTSRTLQKGLNLLGIHTIERM
jgi:arginyl-tRNA synthetase